MPSFSGTSSLHLVAVNATLEDSSFTMGSEVAAHTHQAAEAVKDWCEDKSNEVPYAEFSEQLLREWRGWSFAYKCYHKHTKCLQMVYTQ